LVTSGNFLNSVKSEVIDLEDSNNICQDLEDYPNGDGAVGGLLNQVDPLVCGGGPQCIFCPFLSSSFFPPKDCALNHAQENSLLLLFLLAQKCLWTLIPSSSTLIAMSI
jgi:hypothetical protein